jgi:uncharacterized membrane protein (UPF0127 family)
MESSWGYGMGRNKGLVLAGVFSLFLLGTLSACHPRQGSGLPVVDLRLGEFKVKAEVASTVIDQETGLMFRTRMDENNGMIFVFPDSTLRAFWMRNTYLPLSVAFFDAHGVLLNVEDMQPQTDTPHWSSGLAKYALEMNQGWFQKRGIVAGVKVEGLDKLPPVPTQVSVDR